MAEFRGNRRGMQNWEALEALDNLSPPSPSPSFCDDSAVLYGSIGEIPIFLHTGDDGVIDVVEHEETPGIFYISTPGCSTLDLAECFSSAKRDISLRTLDGQGSPSPSVPTSPSPDSSSVASSSYFEPRPEASFDNLHSSAHTTMPNRNLGSTWTLSRTLFGSGSLLSPSPSMLSVDSDSSSRLADGSWRIRQHAKRSISPLAGVFRSRSPSPNGSIESVPTSPIDGRPPKSPQVTDGNKGGKFRINPKSSPISSPLTSPAKAQIARFPGILGWLEDLELELWIDHEAARTLWPTFKIVGYSSETTDDYAMGIVNALTYGFADFKPVKPQSYPLPKGTLDTPLLLRRLTMAGDNAKDYISRQAYLPVKASGVYAVNGTELFDQHPSHHGHTAHSAQQPLLVRWRFEYEVEDCYSDCGKAVPAQKTFTPLQFSCSPALVHPTHGKKVKSHVWKKSKAPRLIAEKLNVAADVSKDKENTAGFPARSRRASEHRRALSSGPGVLPDVRNMSELPRIIERPVSIMTVPS